MNIAYNRQYDKNNPRGLGFCHQPREKVNFALVDISKNLGIKVCVCVCTYTESDVKFCRTFPF